MDSLFVELIRERHVPPEWIVPVPRATPGSCAEQELLAIGPMFSESKHEDGRCTGRGVVHSLSGWTIRHRSQVRWQTLNCWRRTSKRPAARTTWSPTRCSPRSNGATSTYDERPRRLGKGWRDRSRARRIYQPITSSDSWATCLAIVSRLRIGAG